LPAIHRGTNAGSNACVGRRPLLVGPQLGLTFCVRLKNSVPAAG